MQAIIPKNKAGLSSLFSLLLTLSSSIEVGEVSCIFALIGAVVVLLKIPQTIKRMTARRPNKNPVMANPLAIHSQPDCDPIAIHMNAIIAEKIAAISSPFTFLLTLSSSIEVGKVSRIFALIGAVVLFFVLREKTRFRMGNLLFDVLN